MGRFDFVEINPVKYFEYSVLEIGIDYEYRAVNLLKGEQLSPGKIWFTSFPPSIMGVDTLLGSYNMILVIYIFFWIFFPNASLEFLYNR